MSNPASSSSGSTIPPSILTTVQSLATQDGLSTTSPLHPFSESPEETLTALRSILTTTTQISQSLANHVGVTMSETKLLSLFRQYTTIINNVHVVRSIPIPQWRCI